MHFMSSYDSGQNKFRHEKKKTRNKTKTGDQKNIINSKSYWQTTSWNIRRIMKSLFIPTGNHYHFLYLGFPQPTLKPPNLGPHSTTTALL